MRTRFAPSPTGDLHLGGAYVAFASWLRARASDGAFVLRMEDLDRPRNVPGAAERILEDLRFLGLSWDEGPGVSGPHAPYVQSERAALHEAAIAKLDALGLVYPCTCSRAEIARVASAPHAGEEGPRYPGTCRDPKNRRSDRPAALRLRIADDHRIVAWDDVLSGHHEEDVLATVGDFVLRRADGIPSYQLAVAVDDAAMAIDEVVRGDDLASSSARQVLIARLVHGRAPRFLHLGLVLGPDGARLAKRHQTKWSGSTLRELRERGIPREEILGELAHALSLLDAARALTPEEAVPLARAKLPARAATWTPPERWVTPRDAEK